MRGPEDGWVNVKVGYESLKWLKMALLLLNVGVNNRTILLCNVIKATYFI